MKSARVMRIVCIALAMLSALCTPYLMKRAFPRSNLTTTITMNGFGPSQTALPNKCAIQPDAIPKWYVIRFHHVKPERYSDLIGFIKDELRPTQIKSGVKQHDIWTTLNGRNLPVVITVSEPFDSLAQLDEPDIIEKALGADAAELLFAQLNSFFNGTDSYIVRSLPNLGWTNPKFQGLPKMARMQLAYVSRDRKAEYERYLKNELLPILINSDLLGQWRFNITSGGDDGAYLLVSPVENHAELENSSAWNRYLNYEENGLARAILPPGVIVREESWLIRYRSDLSIPLSLSLGLIRNERGWVGIPFTGEELQGYAIKKVIPFYPPIAKAARASGAVQVEILISEQGNVIDTFVLSGHPLLRDACVQAALQWKFMPFKLEGNPVKAIGTLTFNFTLQ